MSRTHYRSYESMADLVEATTAAGTWRERETGSEGQRWRANPRWVGRSFDSWPEVCEAINSLWPEGVAAVEGMLADLRSVELPRPVSRKRRPRWSADQGDEIEPDRLRAGQEPWRELHRESVGAPQHITVVAQVGARCSADPASLLWRGAAAIALADLLEAAGYRVTLALASRAKAAYANGDDSYRHVTLKRADQPVDAASLVNAVSAWCYRTVWLDEHAAQGLRMSDNYGITSAVSGSAPDELRNAVWVEDVYSRQEALALVRRVVAGLG
jgi:hypothetical protein